MVKTYTKFILISGCVVGHLATSFPFIFVIRFAPFKTKRILNHIIGFYSKLILKIAGVKPSIVGLEHADPKKNYFIVSNHLSYLDILVMSSFFPSCYVTSMEMKETPLLGQITTLAGCVFVERRNKKNIKGEIKEIEDALKAGLNVVVFPEATSTDGETVYPFKRSMFQAAIDAKVDILPLTLEYKTLNGKTLDPKLKNFLFWYDDTSFLTHFMGLCKQKSASVQLHVNPIIAKETLPECSGELRDTSHGIVHGKYSSLVGDSLRLIKDHPVS